MSSVTGRGAVLTLPIVYGGTEHVLDAVPTSSDPASLQQPCCFSHLGSLLANLSFVVCKNLHHSAALPPPTHFMFSWVANVLCRVCVPCVLGIGDANTALFHLDNVKLFLLSMSLGIKHLRRQAVCWPPGFSVCTTENLGPQRWLQSALPTDLRPRDPRPPSCSEVMSSSPSHRTRPHSPFCFFV